MKKKITIKGKCKECGTPYKHKIEAELLGSSFVLKEVD